MGWRLAADRAIFDGRLIAWLVDWLMGWRLAADRAIFLFRPGEMRFDTLSEF